ncbi:MAG: erythronate-4-phosphate dehydrogenase, partial [Ghiorsea sp.]
MLLTKRHRPLHIIADANVWGANHAFSALQGRDVQLEILEHKQIHAESVKHADVLLVRSSTKVNASLLEGSSVRFVGTATIGEDHIDKSYLQ